MDYKLEYQKLISYKINNDRLDELIQYLCICFYNKDIKSITAILNNNFNILEFVNRNNYKIEIMLLDIFLNSLRLNRKDFIYNNIVNNVEKFVQKNMSNYKSSSFVLGLISIHQKMDLSRTICLGLNSVESEFLRHLKSGLFNLEKYDLILLNSSYNMYDRLLIMYCFELICGNNFDLIYTMNLINEYEPTPKSAEGGLLWTR